MFHDILLESMKFLDQTFLAILKLPIQSEQTSFWWKPQKKLI